MLLLCSRYWDASGISWSFEWSPNQWSSFAATEQPLWSPQARPSTWIRSVSQVLTLNGYNILLKLMSPVMVILIFLASSISAVVKELISEMLECYLSLYGAHRWCPFSNQCPSEQQIVGLICQHRSWCTMYVQLNNPRSCCIACGNILAWCYTGLDSMLNSTFVLP